MTNKTNEFRCIVLRYINKIKEIKLRQYSDH